MTDRYTDQLRRAAEPFWSRAVEHRFVDELFSATVTDERLAIYLVQDYQFCDAFVALLGQAVASAPTLPSRLGHARQLGAFAGDEDSYFTSAFDALQVSAADRTAPVRWPVTQQFIDLMMEVRDNRSYPHVLVLLVVAEWLYLDWARIERSWPERPEHRGWVEVHNNPGFVDWVSWLRAELDENEPDDPTVRTELEALFVRATELELAFFDAVYH